MLPTHILYFEKASSGLIFHALRSNLYDNCFLKAARFFCRWYVKEKLIKTKHMSVVNRLYYSQLKFSLRCTYLMGKC